MSKKPNRVVLYKIANEKFLEQKAQGSGENRSIFGAKSR